MAHSQGSCIMWHLLLCNFLWSNWRLPPHFLWQLKIFCIELLLLLPPYEYNSLGSCFSTLNCNVLLYLLQEVLFTSAIYLVSDDSQSGKVWLLAPGWFISEHNSLVLVLGTFQKNSYQPGAGSETFLKLSYQLWSWYLKLSIKSPSLSSPLLFQ